MDRADVVAMLAFRLMQLRTQEALDKERPIEDFSKVFGRKKSGYRKVQNPFLNRGSQNPFSGNNPFR